LPFQEHIKNLWAGCFVQLSQIFLTITFLPHQAWNQTYAIFRTGYRKLISKKHLLEWDSFAQTHGASAKKRSWWAAFKLGPLFAFIVFLVIVDFRLHVIWVASSVLLLWKSAPFLNIWKAIKASK